MTSKYSATGFAGSPQEPRSPLGSWGGSGPLARRAPWAGFAWALACLLALSGTPQLASAEQPAKAAQDDPRLPPGEPLAGPNGQRGVWWPLATAQLLAREHKMLFEITKLSAVQAQKITLLEERLELRLAADQTLQLQVGATQEALDGCAEREAKQVLQTLAVEQKLSRARWIWASIGAVGTALVFGGALAIASGR